MSTKKRLTKENYYKLTLPSAMPGAYECYKCDANSRTIYQLKPEEGFVIAEHDSWLCPDCYDKLANNPTAALAEGMYEGLAVFPLLNGLSSC